MAVVYNVQYNPVSNSETSYDSAMSVRWARDCGDNLNHAKAHALNTRLRGQFFAQGQFTPESNTDEVCLAILSPIYVPDAYNRLAWTLGYKHTAGSNSCTLKAYTLTGLWRDSPVMNSAAIVGEWHSSEVVSETGSGWNIAVARDLEIARDAKGRCWTIITGKNADSSTRVGMYTLDIWAYLSV
mgnify:CR=1 FL=1